ncbi:unnamed protein product [Prunus armeniaca]|uniref:Uncharacterized protein n=1 Tax=Prunus armeniaca TaxID=36596 RepID=A0A6J5U1V9_PRUAR|nr:unnamed protein product [Prunus armeniaca]
MNLSNETNAAADEIEVEDVQAAQPKQASLEQLMIHMLEKWDNQAKAFQSWQETYGRATASPRRGNNSPGEAKLIPQPVEIPAGTSNWFRGHTGVVAWDFSIPMSNLSQ